MPECQQKNAVAGILHQNTVEERMKRYTKHQVEEARKAVDLIKALGLQSWKDLLTVVRSNVIQNNPVTEKHIQQAVDWTTGWAAT